MVNNEYEEEGVKAAIGYMNAFNERNPDGCNAHINFPHARVGAEANLVVNEKPEVMTPQNFFENFSRRFEWNHSCWDYRKVIQSKENKVHLQVQFSRYRADGSKIGTYPSLWIMTKQDNHWGIKMRSSFAM